MIVKSRKAREVRYEFTTILESGATLAIAASTDLKKSQAGVVDNVPDINNNVMYSGNNIEQSAMQWGKPCIAGEFRNPTPSTKTPFTR